MTTRGLPGFLRRSIRVTDEDEEEEDEEQEQLEQVEEETAQQRLKKEQPQLSLDSSEEQEEEEVEPDETAAVSEEKLASKADSAVPVAAADNSEKSRTKVTFLPDDSSASKSSESWQEVSKPPMPSQGGPTTAPVDSEGRRKSYRDSQFERVIDSDVVNMEELRKLGWNGIPHVYRAQAWKLMLGYLPANRARRQQTLQRKRSEYKDAMAQHYDIDDDIRTLQEQETLRQVLVDVPRTAPEVPLFRNDRIRRILSRLLYIWAMRHPASSYVQGINDLATPLLVVFLADYYEGGDVLDGHVMNHLSDERLDELEADVYWCLTHLLAGIQDHYTSDQPGVQRMVARLEELVARIDSDLCRHLQDMGIQFLQFSFKWMNCLLLREFNLKCVIRLWDTYISEKDGFEDFHVYVCAAFLCQFSPQLQAMTFDELFCFMQDIPTSDWTDTEIEMLLSQAFVLSTLFGGSDAHLSSSSSNVNTALY